MKIMQFTIKLLFTPILLTIGLFGFISSESQEVVYNSKVQQLELKNDKIAKEISRTQKSINQLDNISVSKSELPESVKTEVTQSLFILSQLLKQNKEFLSYIIRQKRGYREEKNHIEAQISEMEALISKIELYRGRGKFKEEKILNDINDMNKNLTVLSLIISDAMENQISDHLISIEISNNKQTYFAILIGFCVPFILSLMSKDYMISMKV